MVIIDKLKTFISKKLFITILTGIVSPALISWGIPTTVVSWLIGLAATYVGAQGVVDAVAAHKG
jgi:hypothetical protein